MNNSRASLVRILVTDFPTFAAAVLMLSGWIFVMFDLLRGREVSTNFLLGWGVVTIVALTIILWRVVLIFTVFNEAQEVPATITDVSFFRDRGQIRFLYSYQGEKWASSNYVLKNKRTSKFAPGDTVSVFVDRNHPKKAYIKAIFQ